MCSNVLEVHFYKYNLCLTADGVCRQFNGSVLPTYQRRHLALFSNLNTPLCNKNLYESEVAIISEDFCCTTGFFPQFTPCSKLNPKTSTRKPPVTR